MFKCNEGIIIKKIETWFFDISQKCNKGIKIRQTQGVIINPLLNKKMPHIWGHMLIAYISSLSPPPSNPQ